MPAGRALTLHPDEARQLREWAADAANAPRRALRARIVLELARGASAREVAERIQVHPETVLRWWRRFEVNRLDGLVRDAPRVRVRGVTDPALVDRILRATWEERPASGSRWTTRSLARTLHVNHMLVHRVWQAHGVSFATTPGELERRSERPPVEVLGVFLDGPAALAVRVFLPHETAGHARDTGPAPPPTATSRSGAYTLGRNVRTSLGLRAALDRAYEVAAPSSSEVRWSSPELFVFLRSIDERTPPPAEIHIFFDRAPPEAEPRLEAWGAAHPRFHFHNPAPGEPWVTAIDRWLRTGPLRTALEDRVRVAAAFDAAIARVFQTRGERPGRLSRRSGGTAE
ncbi:MAG TPA: helix-turn-helix domain-containing protein [Thermoplasmata archaeon]|nr:helix-turn-helix domain-containing protein [Thermoplasmata archaeon]